MREIRRTDGDPWTLFELDEDSETADAPGVRLAAGDAYSWLQLTEAGRGIFGGACIQCDVDRILEVLRAAGYVIHEPHQESKP